MQNKGVDEENENGGEIPRRSVDQGLSTSPKSVIADLLYVICIFRPESTTCTAIQSHCNDEKEPPSRKVSQYSAVDCCQCTRLRNTISEVLHLAHENGLNWLLDDSVSSETIMVLLVSGHPAP